MAEVHVGVADGVLVLREIPGGDYHPWPNCEACKERPAEVIVERYRPRGAVDPDLQLGMCGLCIAGALAVKLAAEHVRDGGSMDDLQVREPR